MLDAGAELIAGYVKNTISCELFKMCIRDSARTGDFVGMPFKCVAVIGLNDGESFPGSSRREEFDLTAAKLVVNGKELHVARRGDRDSRESNRGLFLDLLLSAQRHFYVSYTIGSGSVQMCIRDSS